MRDRIEVMRELAKFVTESTAGNVDIRKAIGNFMFCLAEESEFLRDELRRLHELHKQSRHR